MTHLTNEEEDYRDYLSLSVAKTIAICELATDWQRNYTAIRHRERTRDDAVTLREEGYDILDAYSHPLDLSTWQNYMRHAEEDAENIFELAITQRSFTLFIGTHSEPRRIPMSCGERRGSFALVGSQALPICVWKDEFDTWLRQAIGGGAEENESGQINSPRWSATGDVAADLIRGKLGNQEAFRLATAFVAKRTPLVPGVAALAREIRSEMDRRLPLHKRENANTYEERTKSGLRLIAAEGRPGEDGNEGLHVGLSQR